ncbi:Immunoglobulin I-set domain containing protein [Aphelenchoides avenae]|nr:Immunoglobulin I-set domain containing protein [Aphelenchus avenae]
MRQQFTFAVSDFRLVLLLLVYLIDYSHAREAFAQGNLAVVYPAKSGKYSEAHPALANVSDLWCRATEDGETSLPLKDAHFVHFNPHKVHKASIIDNRAYLHLGAIPATAVGVYRCELTTEDGRQVWGNLFVNLRPIFNANGSRFDPVDDERPFEFDGPTRKVIRGETAVLQCPVLAHPPPEIEWFKDLRPINKSHEKYIPRLGGKYLSILDSDDADEGVYRCVARNRFSLVPLLDEEPTEFEAVLNQPLSIRSSLSWLIPLILIIVILILLFIVIYTCAWWKRYKHSQYNVAEKE